jgi:hypothetical protein
MLRSNIPQTALVATLDTCDFIYKLPNKFILLNNMHQTEFKKTGGKMTIFLFLFQLATKIVTFFIQHFGMRDLFGRENYEYYARLTGRILRVEDEWIFFTYPPVTYCSSEAISEVGRGDLVEPGSIEAGASASISNEDLRPEQRLDRGDREKAGSLEIIPENCPLDPNGRLSISLDDKNVSSPSSCGSPNQPCRHNQTLSQRPPHPTSNQIETSSGPTSRRTSSSRHHEVKSYSCLPQVSLFFQEKLKLKKIMECAISV